MSGETFRLTDDLLKAALTREPNRDLVVAVADDVAWTAARTAQRRPRLAWWRWYSDPDMGASAFSRRVPPVLLAAALLLGLAIAVAIVGARLEQVDPVRLAGNGLVVFSTQSGDMLVMNSDGSGARTMDRRPARGLGWSEDGTRLAFWEGIGRKWDLNLFDPATDSITTVTSFDLDRPFFPASEPLQWSADAGAVLSGQGEDLLTPGVVTIDLKTGETRALVSPNVRAIMPVWSPDRTRLVYMAQPNVFPEEEWKLYVADWDGSRPTEILLPEGASFGSEPKWWPDSGSLVVTATRDDSHALFRVDASGGGATRLTSWDPIWRLGYPSPDGSFIAVATFDWETETGNISVMPAAGGDQRWLGSGCQALRWAPDGTAVLFATCPVGPTISLVTAPVDGSATRILWTRPRQATFDFLEFSWQPVPKAR